MASRKKSPRTKKFAPSPIATGGLGNVFENRVQAFFAVLMATNGVAPCINPPRRITKIKLQGRYAGYETDDMILFTEDAKKQQSKLIAQIKLSIKLKSSDKEFQKVLGSAWKDFNNTKLFSKQVDRIALIVPPSNASDQRTMATLMELARGSDSAFEFMTENGSGKITSLPQEKMLAAIRMALTQANSGIAISDKELWEFLKHYHILTFDLELESGGALSTLHSIIGQYTDDIQGQWTRMISQVQSDNPRAGTLTKERLPEEIRLVFEKRREEVIPKEFAPIPQDVSGDWVSTKAAKGLVAAALIGGWNDGVTGDKDVSASIANETFDSWIEKIRDILNLGSSPIALKNGTWRVSARLKTWSLLGVQIFDEHLDRFQQGAIKVLSERDPQFEMDPDNRVMASLQGKVLAHSHPLRRGIAEGLALLGCHPKPLKHTSFGKAESVPAIVVRTVLKDADWKLWASLNDLLPTLAEAAPNQFLEAVEDALQNSPSLFRELFAQEGRGVWGTNYMTGTLWALEGLAWDEQLLPRVTAILGELAAIDPGGSWSNRPINSLRGIFLPWLPQTMAPVEKRRIAIESLQKDLPEVGWRLLLGLLPNQNQMSMGSHKPTWRQSIPEEKSKGVTTKEYWEQVGIYADMAAANAIADTNRLVELVEQFESLTRPAAEKVLSHLTSDAVLGIAEEQRMPLWTKLVEVADKHKKFAGSDWAMPKDMVDQIALASKALAPKSLLNIHRRLFDAGSFDLYENDNEDWSTQQKNLEKRRLDAINEILATHGLDATVDFSRQVQHAYDAGFALGVIAHSEADSVILPTLLENADGKTSDFVRGFIWGRFHNGGWKWADEQLDSGWATRDKVKLLGLLSFNDETWDRVSAILGNQASEYWSEVAVRPYWEGADLNRAIDKLIEHGRACAAIECLHVALFREKSGKNKSGSIQVMDRGRAIKALLAAVSTEEPAHEMNVYHTIDIIKALQNDPNTDQDNLFKVEWAYLAILKDNAYPKFLSDKMATEPGFFCEIIRLMYRPEGEPPPAEKPSEEKVAIARNADRLIDAWRTIPGTKPDGSFSGPDFTQWVRDMKQEAAETKHLTYALYRLGGIFVGAPEDPSGLWIHKAIAEVLNARDAEKMRRAYISAIYNSRGVHTVVSSGQPERDLADKYRIRAKEVEAAGYQRLATSLRGLAETYDNEAERVIMEHRKEIEE